MSLKEGDRVRCLSSSGEIKTGELGTVVVPSEPWSVGVEWDKHSPARHSCSERCKDGHGWYVVGHILKEIEEDSLDGILNV